MKLVLQIALGYLIGKGVELTITYFFGIQIANNMIKQQLGM